MFPTFSFWIFGFVPGFVAGLVVGALAKVLRRGIIGGLVSVFSGSIVSGVIARAWMVDLGFLSGLWSCLPAAAGGALGALFSKNVSRIREFMVKRKRTIVVIIVVVCLALMTPIAGVMLIARISHERCDGLVRLLEDQYSFGVTEKPMQFREEVFHPYGLTKLIDCGGDDELFISELLNSVDVPKVYFFKIPNGAYLWFVTSTWDRLVYVRYGLWQFEPIRYDFGFFWWWIFTMFILPIFILIFVASISAEPEKTEEAITEARLRSIACALKKYPKELADKYQRMYPHNPAGVLEFHISRKMKEGKTRDKAMEELVKEIN